MKMPFTGSKSAVAILTIIMTFGLVPVSNGSAPPECLAAQPIEQNGSIAEILPPGGSIWYHHLGSENAAHSLGRSEGQDLTLRVYTFDCETLLCESTNPVSEYERCDISASWDGKYYSDYKVQVTHESGDYLQFHLSYSANYPADSTNPDYKFEQDGIECHVYIDRNHDGERGYAETVVRSYEGPCLPPA